MSAVTDAIALVRQKPALLVAWIALLALSVLLGFAPLSAALGPVLDLRPAAAHLVTAPTDDGLLVELVERAPELTTLGVTSLFVTLAIGVPLLWLLAGWVAATAIDSPLPASVVAARTCGVAIVALPLRALPWLAAFAIGWPSTNAQTFERASTFVVAAAITYALLSSIVTVLVDLARGVAVDDPHRGWWRTFTGGWRAARAKTFLVLCVLDLASMGIAVLTIATSRPLAVVQGGVLALSLLAILLRACASVVGIAAAARVAASRSA